MREEGQHYNYVENTSFEMGEFLACDATHVILITFAPSTLTGWYLPVPSIYSSKTCSTKTQESPPWTFLLVSHMNHKTEFSSQNSVLSHKLRISARTAWQGRQ
ncbi:hypothetical protein Pelo_11542 [Pelomyxa schiedti]|nr:hypothetical protein Pelo_11542 [Pelomyxa schiedti]